MEKSRSHWTSLKRKSTRKSRSRQQIRKVVITLKMNGQSNLPILFTLPRTKRGLCLQTSYTRESLRQHYARTVSPEDHRPGRTSSRRCRRCSLQNPSHCNFLLENHVLPALPCKRPMTKEPTERQRSKGIVSMHRRLLFVPRVR